ncbi:MAG: hypothetical protein H6517_02690 [Microthrixaceae bacterium]|nr:hypothetical protein [Microthrixaceae bacterium]MCO5320628.1 hypothetical protein [Microthrixaceae bacterium]
MQQQMMRTGRIHAVLIDGVLIDGVLIDGVLIDGVLDVVEDALLNAAEKESTHA